MSADRHAPLVHRVGAGPGAAESASADTQPGTRGLALPALQPEAPPVQRPAAPAARAASASAYPGSAEAAQEEAPKGKGKGKGKARKSDAEELPTTSAWFGTHGTAVSRALSAPRTLTSRTVTPSQPEEADGEMLRLVAESVIGADDRVRVGPAGQVPYEWICALTIVAPNGARWLGTGWFAAPGLVVTAGHCVYLHQCGGWASRVRVQPARDGAKVPYSFESSLLLSVGGWVHDQDTACDYGAVVVPAEATEQIGWFGYGVRGDEDLAGNTINVVGYPSDKPAGTMWGSVRDLTRPTPAELLYTNDTVGGMSGSPVIEWDGSDYSVLGIHNYGDIAGNRATRITPEVFTNLQGWARAAQQPEAS